MRTMITRLVTYAYFLFDCVGIYNVILFSASSNLYATGKSFISVNCRLRTLDVFSIRS